MQNPSTQVVFMQGKGPVALRARIGAVVPCLGNPANTPAQIFAPQMLKLAKAKQKEMAPMENVLNC